VLTVGEKIRRLRREKDLSQAWLADELDMAVSSISMLENGKTDPDTELLWKIAKAFGVFPTIFFEDDGPPTSGRVQEQLVGYNKNGVSNFIFPPNVTAQEREQILKMFNQLVSAGNDERMFALQVMEKVLQESK